jgi:menaquinone-dependent protoporphyrinogen IX oxidase
MQRRTFLNLGIAGVGSTLAMAGPVPFQFIPRPSKEKWAILFGTWCGTSRDAAIWISEGMGGISGVFDIRQVPENLLSYDHLVIGTSIHGGKGPKALEDYIETNAAKLQGKIRGLFACCGNLGKMPGQKQVQDYIENYLAKLCRVVTVPPNQVFGGRITKSVTPPEDYKTIEGLYKSLNMPLADYDNLSRVDCMALGKKILAGKA